MFGILKKYTMDSLGNVGSRKRANVGNHYSAEEQALDAIAKEVCLLYIVFIYYFF